MKNVNLLRNSGLLLVLFFVALSCSTIKKTAVSCPELPRTNAQHKVALKKNRNKKFFSFSNDRKRNHRISKHALKVNLNEKNRITNSTKSNEHVSDLNLPQLENDVNITKAESTNLVETLSIANLPSSKISSLNGPRIGTEFNNEGYDVNSKYYVKTNKTLVTNSDVPIVLNSDEIENSNSSIPNNSFQQGTTTQKVEGLGLAGFIVSLAGLLVFGIPCGIIGVVFGAISLGKIKRYPDKYRGKGFAIASLVIGIVDIVGVIVFLGML